MSLWPGRSGVERCTYLPPTRVRPLSETDHATDGGRTTPGRHDVTLANRTEDELSVDVVVSRLRDGTTALADRVRLRPAELRLLSLPDVGDGYRLWVDVEDGPSGECDWPAGAGADGGLDVEIVAAAVTFAAWSR